MAKKILKYFPTLAVISISFCAFIPGIFVGRINKDIDINRQQLSDMQSVFEWISDEAQNIYNFDSSLYGLAWQEIKQAQMLDTEFSILFSANQTDEVSTQIYMTKIINHLIAAYIITDQTISFSIETTFRTAPELETYVLGVSPTGYEYQITRDDWETKHVYESTSVGTFINTTFGEWYTEGGNLFFDDTMTELQANYTDFLNQPFGWLIAPDAVYSLDYRTNLYNLTHEPLKHIHTIIDDTMWSVITDERIVSNLESIVSIMTVGTLLGTAVSSRLGERKVQHMVSKIRSDVTDGKTEVVKEVDKFSLVILTIAVILAIAGMLFALLYH